MAVKGAGVGLGGIAVADGVGEERSRKGKGSSVGEAFITGEGVWVMNTKPAPRVGSGVAEAQAVVNRINRRASRFTAKLYA